MKPWVPGVAVLSTLLGAGALVGLGLGPRFWPLHVLLAAAGLAVMGWITRQRMRSRPTASRKGREAGPEASPAPYDLESDTSTDDQRWLM